MKLLNIIYYLAVLVLMTTQLFATNTNPVVTNVISSITGSTVTVHYDVTDAEQSTVKIMMEVSSNNGSSWDYNYGTATGDIGTSIANGTNKTITWTYSGTYNPNFIIKIIADDLVGDQIYYSYQIYNTIQIGSQTWLKENLNVGTRINGSVEQTDNGTLEKYCYNDDSANCTTYGGLYEWAEAVQYQNGATDTTVTNPPLTGNVQGICPTGWHLPTIDEYTTLSNSVSGDGNSLKAVGQGIPGGLGTNTSGFSALLSGFRLNDFTFNNLTTGAYFWSSSEFNAKQATDMFLTFHNSVIRDSWDLKADGFSVRCVKD